MSSESPSVSQAELKALLRYDPTTGVFAWRVSRPGRKPGMVAGACRPDGYKQISIAGRLYLSHRLAWLYQNGDLPEFLDHADGDKGNNRIANLRPATLSENQCNRVKQRRSKRSTSRRLGVSRCSDCERWKARIQLGGKSQYLGIFASESEAAEAYCLAKKKLHSFQPIVRRRGRDADDQLRACQAVIRADRGQP